MRAESLPQSLGRTPRPNDLASAPLDLRLRRRVLDPPSLRVHLRDASLTSRDDSGEPIDARTSLSTCIGPPIETRTGAAASESWLLRRRQALTERESGQGEIRTHDTGFTGMPVFETGAFNHSATCPGEPRTLARRR